ncbi:hypothetical protein [Algibacillus agarilyticus]|uniref:hypothetical protein n=1 Tax=Algibacillus agarilyticus TaxID=2234133 RepID=UPI000DD072F0|nr:hypothetical protein [Algibacillus agarilyticus]
MQLKQIYASSLYGLLHFLIGAFGTWVLFFTFGWEIDLSVVIPIIIAFTYLGCFDKYKSEGVTQFLVCVFIPNFLTSIVLSGALYLTFDIGVGAVFISFLLLFLAIFIISLCTYKFMNCIS